MGASIPASRNGRPAFFDWPPANPVYASVTVKIPWQTYLSELMGTALLIGIGLSFVIIDFGTGSPVVAWLPDAGVRRLLTGFLFGAVIAYSPVGKVSGAHINPVVTLAFYMQWQVLGPRCHWLHSGTIRRRHCRLPSVVVLGTGRPKHSIRRHDAGNRLPDLGRAIRRSRHHDGPDCRAVPLSWPPAATPFHAAALSFSLRGDGLSRSAGFRHQHESRPQSGSVGYLGRLVWLVDLFRRAVDRHVGWPWPAPVHLAE